MMNKSINYTLRTGFSRMGRGGSQPTAKLGFTTKKHLVAFLILSAYCFFMDMRSWTLGSASPITTDLDPKQGPKLHRVPSGLGTYFIPYAADLDYFELLNRPNLE